VGELAVSSRRSEVFSPWREFLHLLRTNPLVPLGLTIVLLMILLGVLAPLLAPYPPYETDPARRLLSPRVQHPFGTDQFGQDVFSRVLYGARVTLFVAILAVVMGLLIGTTLGALAGYLGHIPDDLVMRCMDMLQAFPSFILAMAVATAVGPGLVTLIVANAVVNVPFYARLLRSKMISVKQSQYASAAVCVGNPPLRIVFVHLLPNCVGPLIIQATLQSSWAILSAAGLSFLGLGMRVPAAEWGAMIQMGSRYMVTGEWWVAFFPGLAIVLAVLGFNLLGDGLRDLMDPERN
jgi:peptide/nickel transport system permease protein